MYFHAIIIVSCLIALPCQSNAGNIIKYKDEAGSTVFTQNTSDCETNIEDRSDVIKIKETAIKTRVDYRFPPRTYISEKGRWDIYVEENMKVGDKELYESSLRKLNETLDYVFGVMPQNSRLKLSKIRVFLLWGEASPQGGWKSGMSYIRKGEPDNYSYLDKRWEHALIIYSASNLMYLNELWSGKAIFHELAHAWHIVNWPEKYPPIYETWKNVKVTQKYIDVSDVKGKVIKNAYARKNQLEYFAELSAIYFFGGNYFPYDKAGLKQYDPMGYRMIEKLWH